eukprot:TRINITY_DN630_c0_g1_i1.p1 TRINITY_DN630_c0_g1~~TRINITY_DN630_c0_g1_i1.p1  ORF type:complete len:605 (+),score=125.39 TRINITY_DN630_c0_g1_i1:101-1915(+)
MESSTSGESTSSVSIEVDHHKEDHHKDTAPKAYHGATLVWRNLFVRTVKGKKVLLHGVSGIIAGGFWAIMGPSGSGKTTLMNSLSYRLDRMVKQEGERKLNGSDYNKHQLKEVSGYVMQDDQLNGNLTVGETMYYTGRLRLPPSVTAEEREERITEALEQMGLTNSRDTIVGSPMVQGISGGERKRLCVAMELLLRPALLFLDEPTSGLDSVAALSLCTRLKSVADMGGCTIVNTIHQPQSKIFHLFDNLLLLTKGVIVYQGPARGAAKRFAEAGFPLPSHDNPSDHFLDTVTPSFGSGEEKDLSQLLSTPLVVSDEDLKIGSDRAVNKNNVRLSWPGQFLCLFQRSLRETTRKRFLLLVQFVQAILMAVLIGTTFLLLDNSQENVNLRNSVLFFCCINQGVFGALITINSFPAERTLALRERAAGTYQVSAYFLAKNCAETLFSMPMPIIFSCIVYWLVGFQPLASKFFAFMFFMFLSNFAATSLAVCISAVGRTTDMAVTILPLVLEVFRLLGGFFLPPARLPAYFSWLDALSYVKYAYVGVALNEFTDLEIDCPTNSTSACKYTNGQEVFPPPYLPFLSLPSFYFVPLSFLTLSVLTNLGD